MTELTEPLTAARRSGLIDQAIGALRDRIGASGWGIGDRIPSEPDLAEQLGVGRNTVREAVQALVHAGILERRQGSGTYVRATSELAGAVERRLAAADHEHVVEVRRALEVEASRLAALRHTAADADRLRELLAVRRRETAAAASPHIDALVDADVALHLAIVDAAHNPVLAELYAHLLDALSANVRRNVLRTDHADDDHAGLVAAVLAGDADAAGREVGRYLDAAAPD